MSAPPETAAPTAPRELSIRPVRTKRDARVFHELPHQLHARLQHWVPPLRRRQRALVDPRRNGFFQHAEVALFTAHRDGFAVGRIAAIDNGAHTAHHHDRCGFFGLFDSGEDPAIARALLDAAADWLRDRGMNTLRGPVNLSTNGECGMLVDGFDEPPAVLMPYNPAYYPRLLDECGMDKAADLFAWEVNPQRGPTRLLARVARNTARRGDVRVRCLDPRNFERDMDIIRRLHNAACAHNWGFVPIGPAEFRSLVADLRHVVRHELVLLAEVDGTPASFVLSLPDVNHGLRRAEGSLHTCGVPVGLARLFGELRRTTTGRTMLAGTDPRFRGMGLEAVTFATSIDTARDLGFRSFECSWVSEDNLPMNRVLDAIGAERTKRYRVYEAGIRR